MPAHQSAFHEVLSGLIILPWGSVACVIGPGPSMRFCRMRHVMVCGLGVLRTRTGLVGSRDGNVYVLVT